ncbi:MAG: hypothetical protein GC191_11940 [Azospirillum sp.]|nr:hypothetical protein [Azospirillum sp.]
MDARNYAGGLGPAANEAGRARAWAMRLKQAGHFIAPFVALERLFLDFGERLRTLHRKVARVSDDAESAGALLASPDFREMLAAVNDLARGIDALRGRPDDSAATLARLVAVSEAILGTLAALSRIMFQVQVLAVNAKIESSQLARTGVDFTVFTNEITRLAGCGEAAIGGVRLELTALRAAASAAITEQSAFEQAGMRELHDLFSRLTALIAALEQRQALAENGVSELVPLLRSLSGHIGQVVSDLQIFDITRQRLEHVEQALDLAAGMIEAEGASDMDALQQQVFVNGIAELQAAQLTQAVDGYDRAVLDIGGGMQAMTKGVPVIAALSENAFGGGGGESVEAVNRDLEKAGALFATFTAGRDHAEKGLGVVAAAAARARGLIRSLNSVNADMRLMALNASIKCGNMGDRGRTLQVVANELQALARLTGEHVDLVAANLAQAVSVADEIGGGRGSARAADILALQSALDLASARLANAGARLPPLLDGITANAAAVVELGRVAAEGFTERVACSGLVARSVSGLEALAGDTAPGLTGEALEAARSAVLAFAEAHYTMASERAIHGSAVSTAKLTDLLKGSPPAAVGAGATAPPAGEPDISDLLF